MQIMATQMMETGGAFLTKGCKSDTCVWNNGTAKQFHYTQPYDWYFCYRHLVDDHNNKQHTNLSLEDSWKTDCWPFCVFTFLFAVTEVSVFWCTSFGPTRQTFHVCLSMLLSNANWPVNSLTIPTLFPSTKRLVILMFPRRIELVHLKTQPSLQENGQAKMGLDHQTSVSAEGLLG